MKVQDINNWIHSNKINKSVSFPVLNKFKIAFVFICDKGKYNSLHTESKIIFLNKYHSLFEKSEFKKLHNYSKLLSTYYTKFFGCNF